MCKKCVKVNSVSPSGIKQAYVPCGKCVDCRRKLAQSWCFRINSEFLALKRQGWNVAFCTLTYRDADLPKIPDICFCHADEVREIPCFNRSQVRDWIDEVRQYFKYHSGFVREKRMRYFIATELGTLRHRPHMHVILAWHPSVSYEEMHSVCSDKWRYGFLFPRDYRGDKGMMPFEIVGDASKCFTYVSKYVCKDLELEKLLGSTDFYSEGKLYEEGSFERTAFDAWRNCQSFHIQSQSLGFEPIKRMSDYEKREAYVNGMAFQGDGHVYKLPLYIKNRIVFDNYYQFEEVVDKETGEVTYKRLVRRRASKFFEKYRREIFDKKAEFYHKYVLQTNKSWLLSNGVSEEIASYYDYAIKYCYDIVKSCYNENDLVDGHTMGKLYLAYNYVPFDQCFDIDLCEQWFRRYLKPDELKYDFCLYDSYALSALRNYWSWIDEANTYIGVSKIGDRVREDALSRKILDFFNNITKSEVL